VRIIRWLLLLLVVVFGMAFALLNATPVLVNFYVGSREWPLAWVLLLALLLGTLIGVLASLAASVGLRRELSQLRRQQRLERQEIANLRTLPIKE
jgi:lipopolysaccharide assembly protein A